MSSILQYMFYSRHLYTPKLYNGTAERLWSCSVRRLQKGCPLLPPKNLGVLGTCPLYSGNLSQVSGLSRSVITKFYCTVYASDLWSDHALTRAGTFTQRAFVSLSTQTHARGTSATCSMGMFVQYTCNTPLQVHHTQVVLECLRLHAP